MLDVVLTGLFTVLAYRISTGVYKESAVFLEYSQSRLIALIVLLFPFCPIAVLLLARREPLVAWIIFPLVFGSALFVARRNARALSRAGTDRVNKALAAANLAVDTSIGGLVYFVVALTYALLVGTYGTAV
jgi:hypothetical protein